MAAYTQAVAVADRIAPKIHFAHNRGALQFQSGHPRVHPGVSEKQLQAYLPEICIGFNRRFRERELWERTAKAWVSTGTLTYNRLTKKDAANRSL